MSDTAVDRVLLWMANGLSGADLEAAVQAKLDVDPARVKPVIAEARKRLTLAAEYNRDEILGTAMTRLNDLYRRCVAAQNDAKALDVQKEINRLAGLHGSPGGSQVSSKVERFQVRYAWYW